MAFSNLKKKILTFWSLCVLLPIVKLPSNNKPFLDPSFQHNFGSTGPIFENELILQMEEQALFNCRIFSKIKPTFKIDWPPY